MRALIIAMPSLRPILLLPIILFCFAASRSLIADYSAA